VYRRDSSYLKERLERVLRSLRLGARSPLQKPDCHSAICPWEDPLDALLKVGWQVKLWIEKRDSISRERHIKPGLPNRQPAPLRFVAKRGELVD
jgi:hypothetical protein